MSGRVASNPAIARTARMKVFLHDVFRILLLIQHSITQTVYDPLVSLDQKRGACGSPDRSPPRSAASSIGISLLPVPVLLVATVRSDTTISYLDVTSPVSRFGRIETNVPAGGKCRVHP